MNVIKRRGCRSKIQRPFPETRMYAWQSPTPGVECALCLLRPEWSCRHHPITAWGLCAVQSRRPEFWKQMPVWPLQILQNQIDFKRELSTELCWAMSICTCAINKNLALGIMLVCTTSPHRALQCNIELTNCAALFALLSVLLNGATEKPLLFKTSSSISALSRSVDIQGILAPPQPGRSWTGIWIGLVAASLKSCTHAHGLPGLQSLTRAAVCLPSHL